MNENIRCIIVDDEFPARILLKEFVEKVPGLELVGSFKSGLEALQVIQGGGVDLMFLDIQMPDITGVNFLKMLTHKPLVVFTTAYSEYAIESYQLDVLDYLLKPFSFDRFMQTIGKAMARLRQPQNVSAAQQPTNSQAESAESEVARDTPQRDVMLVKADHKIHRIRYNSIIYIEGLREYVTIFCENNEKVITLESLRNLEATLPADMFMRIHKSYIVRIDKIKQLYGNQVKIEGVQSYIPIGKSYKDIVQSKLFEE